MCTAGIVESLWTQQHSEQSIRLLLEVAQPLLSQSKTHGPVLLDSCGAYFFGLEILAARILSCLII